MKMLLSAVVGLLLLIPMPASANSEHCGTMIAWASGETSVIEVPCSHATDGTLVGGLVVLPVAVEPSAQPESRDAAAVDRPSEPTPPSIIVAPPVVTDAQITRLRNESDFLAMMAARSAAARYGQWLANTRPIR